MIYYQEVYDNSHSPVFNMVYNHSLVPTEDEVHFLSLGKLLNALV